MKQGNPFGVLRSLSRSYAGEGNPLKEKSQRSGTYEQLNRDAGTPLSLPLFKLHEFIVRFIALAVCEKFASSANASSSLRRPFIYLSAEDVFRPFIPQRYIVTKRQAERRIAEIMRDRTDLRAAFVRPSMCVSFQFSFNSYEFSLGFVYQSHTRPLTTPIATLLDFSSVVHKKIPNGIPTPSGLFRALASTASPREANQIDLESSPFASIANGLVIPPIHVDHVAEAICKVILDDSIEGVVDVDRMRELIGWVNKGKVGRSSPSDA